MAISFEDVSLRSVEQRKDVILDRPLSDHHHTAERRQSKGLAEHRPGQLSGRMHLCSFAS